MACSISNMFWTDYSLYEELSFADILHAGHGFNKMWFIFLSKTSLLVTFWPLSDYINVFDGTGAQIFMQTGCQKNHTSNTFLEIAFQESQNVTIQASLNHYQSYARVSYGILKNGLDSGDGLRKYNWALSNHDDGATRTFQICIFGGKKEGFLHALHIPISLRVHWLLTSDFLRVHVSKNQTFSNFRGHSSKIDFAQILSRCSLLCL